MTQKIALVTGASRGLGAAIAEALAPTYHVVALARTVGALEELDDRIKARGGAATLAPMDITNTDAMRQLCASIHARWGKLDLWVHAAVHSVPLSPADHITEKEWDACLNVNARATGHLITFLSPLLNVAPAPRAVFFADDHAGEKFFGAFAASKGAQITLAQAWARETENTGPKVDIVAPRAMPTASRARFFPGEDRALLAAPGAEAARLLGELGLK